MQRTSCLGGRRPQTGAALLWKISPREASRGEAELARALSGAGRRWTPEPAAAPGAPGAAPRVGLTALGAEARRDGGAGGARRGEYLGRSREPPHGSGTGTGAGGERGAAAPPAAETGWAGLCGAVPGSRARGSQGRGRRPLGGAGGRERGCRSGVTRGHPLCSAGGASRTPPPPQPPRAEPAPPARPRAARQPLLSWPWGSPAARAVAAVPAPALLRIGEPNGSAGKASRVKLPRLLSWEKKDPCLRAAPETGCKPVQNRDARCPFPWYQREKTEPVLLSPGTGHHAWVSPGHGSTEGSPSEQGLGNVPQGGAAGQSTPLWKRNCCRLHANL